MKKIMLFVLVMSVSVISGLAQTTDLQTSLLNLKDSIKDSVKSERGTLSNAKFETCQVGYKVRTTLLTTETYSQTRNVYVGSTDRNPGQNSQYLSQNRESVREDFKPVTETKTVENFQVNVRNMLIDLSLLDTNSIKITELGKKNFVVTAESLENKYAVLNTGSKNMQNQAKFVAYTFSNLQKAEALKNNLATVIGQCQQK